MKKMILILAAMFAAPAAMAASEPTFPNEINMSATDSDKPGCITAEATEPTDAPRGMSCQRCAALEVEVESLQASLDAGPAETNAALERIAELESQLALKQHGQVDIFEPASEAEAAMIEPQLYGQIGYEAYAQSTGGKTHDGRDMPQWVDLPIRIQQAWADAAKAIRRAA